MDEFFLESPDGEFRIEGYRRRGEVRGDLLHRALSVSGEPVWSLLGFFKVVTGLPLEDERAVTVDFGSYTKMPIADAKRKVEGYGFFLPALERLHSERSPRVEEPT